MRLRPDRPEVNPWSLLADVIAQLDDHTPHEDTEPLLDAALRLAKGLPDRLRSVATQASRLWQFAVVEKAVDGLGELRIARDVLQGAYARFCGGDARGALVALTAIPEATLAG